MISVIVVNYHSAHQTERAIKSVLEDGGEREIIVVDNTCAPDEREILDEFRREYGIVLIMNERNVGFGRACNQAFARSSGEYIFLLNPDAFVVSPCLGILEEFLDSKSSAGSVSPQVFWDDERQYLFPCYSVYAPFEALCFQLSVLSDTFRSFYSLFQRRKNLALWTLSKPVAVENLHGGVAMVRRSAAEKAGGLFDERFFLFFEDTDLFFRLRKTGYGLYILPEAKAVHNHVHSPKKLDTITQMSRLYYEKHYRRSILLKISESLPGGLPERSCYDLGAWSTPPLFHVQDTLAGGKYLFEWSPNPVFVPSIGSFGSGGEFELSRQIWDLLDNGRYFSRFTPCSGSVLSYTTCCWEKAI
ncbi:MAG TPA: glycosyltransferase family 2 protein [Thermodesulfovibrionales bacterium]|nr:glycosyltransferase family 2 protein [Thermodesulfovibrionales bacterium]